MLLAFQWVRSRMAAMVGLVSSIVSPGIGNISRGGTFIKTSRPLPVGTEFLFKLFVPGRLEPLTIHGEVQRIIDAVGFANRRGSRTQVVNGLVKHEGFNFIFDFIEGGVEDEHNVARNLDALGAFRLNPRVLVDVSKVDTRAELFGAPLAQVAG